MHLQIIATIRKFFSHSYEEKDVENLFFWFNSEKGRDEISRSLDNGWDSFDYEPAQVEIDSDKLLRNIRIGIQKQKNKHRRIKLMKRLPYAAVLFVLITLTIVINSYNRRLFQADKNEYTLVITENGQRSKVVLPDSSIVWLNSGTTLSYNYNSGNSRLVKLKGQGFFEITRDESRPFVVQSGDLQVEVLGTRFDVNAYPGNEEISVVLESGSVLLSHSQLSLDCVLEPGEQADYDVASNKVSVHQADIEKLTSWKDGKLIFKNDPMKLVFEKLERWYNIDIEVLDEEVYSSIFTGTVINNEDYSQIFKLIEFSCPLQCRVVNGVNAGEIPKVIITRL